MSNDNLDGDQAKVSCDERMSRQQFVSKLVRQATLLGTLTVAPAIVEQFIAPPAVAAASGGGGPIT